MPKAAKSTQATEQVFKNEWVWDKPVKPMTDVFAWIAEHQAKIEKNMPNQASFLAACKEANVNPPAKFAELLKNLLNPADLFWMEFRETFKQTVGGYAHRVGISEDQRTEFIENALYGSFSRIIRQPLSKKLS